MKSPTAESSHYQLDAGGHRGTPAVQRLVEYAPSTGALALWMRHRDVDDLASLPTAAGILSSGGSAPIANDGHTLFYAPAFDSLPLEEQCGVVAHQLLHVVLRHCARLSELEGLHGEVDRTLFTACADSIVNASLSHLSWLRLPQGSVQLETLLLKVLGIDEPVSASLHRWDTESLYRAIDDRQQHGSRSSSGRSTSAREGNDDRHREESRQARHETEQEARQQRKDGPKAEALRKLTSDSQQDLLRAAEQRPEARASDIRQWSERLTRAHAADGEQSLLRELLADRPRVRTPWEHLLRTRMNRSLRAQPSLSWSRPTRSWIACQGRTANGRRLPWQPGNSAFVQAPRLCVIVDVSGSIDDALMARFSSEIDRILRVHRCDITLIIGDDAVRKTVRLRAGCQELRELTCHGRGGTDFRPLLAAAARRSPDLVIVLTDLDGPAGDPCPFPVLWAVIPGEDTFPTPFGKRVQLAD